MSWLIAFIVTKFFSKVTDTIGVGQTFFVFAAFAAACTIFVWSFVPETKGKSFHDIQRSLGSDADDNDTVSDDKTTITGVSQNTIAI